MLSNYQPDTGHTPRMTKVMTDAWPGAERATMPAPVMWDASVDERSGEHTNRGRVDMKVVNNPASQYT